MVIKPTYQELENRVGEMEAELSDVNEKLERRHNILSALDTGICVINPDRSVDWVNEKMRRMYPGRELIGCICHICFDASDTPCDPCPMRQCFLTGEIHQIDQFNPVTQNWLHIVSQPIKDADGRVVRVLEAIRNVTERKRIEQMKEEALEMLRLAMESADEGVWEWNVETDLVRFDPMALRMLGYGPRMPLKRIGWWFKRFHPDDLPRVQKAFDAYLSGEGGGYAAEFRLKGKNGEYVWVASHARIIGQDDGGRPLRVVGIHREISKQKKAEKRIRDNERKLHDLLQSIQAGIIVHEADSLAITEINSAAEKMLGVTDASLIGKTAPPSGCILLDEDETPLTAVDWPARTVQRTREPLKDFVMGVRSPGRETPVWALINTEPQFDENGTMNEIIISSMDVSELKRIQRELKVKERQLLQSQKMESIGTLAGGIAHDFNNILMPIIGYTEMSLEYVVKDSLIASNLNEVLAAAKRAKELVGQILAFARQSGEEVRPVRVDHIVGEVLKLIRSAIPTTIEIRQIIESKAMIMGNATKMHQVLMNLCTNAAHAMEKKGGVLEVRLEDAVMDGSKDKEGNGLTPGDYLKLTVSDTGEGIPPDRLNMIFEPYFTTKGKGEGTGMGLAVVQGIVGSYDGTITVESTLGHGTVFKIYLPVAKTQKEIRPYEPDAFYRGTERILFVDDEAPIANVSHMLLERLGYVVTARTSSVEALEMFRASPHDFDLVITDMTMPGLTGDRLALKLIKIRPDIPVILCTGHSKSISLKTAITMGIKALIFKPFKKAELATTVRTVLNESQARRTAKDAF